MKATKRQSRASLEFSDLGLRAWVGFEVGLGMAGYFASI